MLQLIHEIQCSIELTHRNIYPMLPPALSQRQVPRPALRRQPRIAKERRRCGTADAAQLFASPTKPYP
jgi:hypothetical protein